MFGEGESLPSNNHPLECLGYPPGSKNTDLDDIIITKVEICYSESVHGLSSVLCSLAPALADELLVCEECGTGFAESYLWSKFNLQVCNSCR